MQYNRIQHSHVVAPNFFIPCNLTKRLYENDLKASVFKFIGFPTRRLEFFAKWKKIKGIFFLHDIPTLEICLVHTTFYLFASFNIDCINPVIETPEYLPWKRYIQKSEIDFVVYFCYALNSAALSEHHGGY